VFTRCDRFEADVALAIWCAGDDLIDRDVVEIGCGCGVLGKQFGTVARSYLGLDYSELALAIARGASPSNCTYGMPSDRKLLEPLAHSCDTLVGREFFIHQNLDQARRVLRIARHLIRPGGIICADFYHTNPDIPQGAVHPADSPLDPQYASAGFHYEPADTQLLADEFGLTIRSQDRDFERQRLFTIFEVGA
jgi:SAM-dependent methyltransferase